MNRTIAIVEARMTSTRLPGKVLKTIAGRPTLEILVERLKAAQTLDAVGIATTGKPTDDPVAALAKRLGVECFRGSEHDVLDRVARAARAFGAHTIVEITGDCPLMDPRLVDQAVSVYRANDVDYVGNRLSKSYPDGMGVRVFSNDLIQAVALEATDPADREHVTTFVFNNPARFRLMDVPSGLDTVRQNYRITMDTQADFDLIERIFTALDRPGPVFGLMDIIEYLEANPEIIMFTQKSPTK